MSFKSQVPNPTVMREVAIMSLSALYAYTLAEREEGANVITETTKSLVEKGKELAGLKLDCTRQQGEIAEVRKQLAMYRHQSELDVAKANELENLLSAAQETVTDLQGQLSAANAKLSDAGPLGTQRIVLIAELTRERDELREKVRQLEASKAAAQSAGMTEERVIAVLNERFPDRYRGTWKNAPNRNLNSFLKVFFEQEIYLNAGIYTPAQLEAIAWWQNNRAAIEVPPATHPAAASTATPGVNDPDYDNAPADAAPLQADPADDI